MSLVPTDFTIVGDAQCASMGEGDGDGEVLSEKGEDCFFVAFGVHEGQGVVVLEHDDGDVHAPQFEEGLVDDVGLGVLWVIG